MNRSLRTLFIINSIFVFASSLFGPLYAVFVESLTPSIVSISITWSIFLLASTITTFLLSLYGDRIKETEHLLTAGFFLRAVAWLGMSFVTSLPQLALVQVVIGVGEGLGTPAFNAIFAKHLDAHRQVREYSSWKVMSNLLAAISVSLGGFIVVNYGFSILFYIMSTLAIISGIITLTRSRKLL